MSAIMKLRQARNVEQIADELEPLALSLAALADQAQASIQRMEEASFRQSNEWHIQQTSAALVVETAAQQIALHTAALQQATASLNETVAEFQQAQRSHFWTLAGVALLSALFAATLSTAFWLLLEPVPQNTLDAKAVAEGLRAPLTEALRRK